MRGRAPNEMSAGSFAHEGLVIVDKPPAHTSHDVVARCRRLFKTRKVGHAGTLDPDATGVLVLGVGRATRLLRFVQGLDKAYRARICFGVGTDTLDSSGKVLSRHEMPISEAQLREVLGKFEGQIEQIPPMVSAIKVRGEPLYRRALRGEQIERQARKLTIYELRLEQFSPGLYPEAIVYVLCSSGTYVRSIAADLGVALGGSAHLGSLRRLAVGPFDESIACTLDELEEFAANKRISDSLISMEESLPHLPSVVVDEKTSEGVKHGMIFPASVLKKGAVTLGGPLAVFGPDRRLLAVYGPHRTGAKPLCVIAE